MKEASGELNMTLVTIIAIAAVLAIVQFVIPAIKDSISDKWSDINESEVEFSDTK